MKKVLSVLLVLVLAAALLIAYQWRRAADRLALAARGGSYRSLGLKLEIAPGRGGVQGMLRLKPYVEIPQVVLDLSAWGLEGPVPLGSARLSTQLWRNAGFLLTLEPGGVVRDGFEAKRVAFELSLPDLILGLRSEAFVLRDTGAGESLTLREPWLQLGSREVPVPANLNLRLEGVQYERRREGRPRQEVELGPIEAGYVSEPRGGERHWKFFHRGQGGGYLTDEVRGEVGAWSLKAEGRFVDLPWERWKGLGEEWARLLGLLKAPETLPAVESLPGTEAAVDKTVAFLLDWSPRVDRVEFRWAGIKVGDEPRHARFELKPVEFAASYSEDASGLTTEASGSLQGLEADFKGSRLELSGLKFSQRGRVGLSYREWLRYFADYYGTTLALSRQPQDWRLRMGALYGAYFAQMPDELKGEVSLEALKFQNPRYQTEHRGAALTYAADGSGWNYRVRDDFDSVLSHDPGKSIRQGKLDLGFGFSLPWAELLRHVRRHAAPAESAPSLAAALSGRPSGVDWKWVIDLGPDLFALQLDLKLSADAGKLAGVVAPLWSASDAELKAGAPRVAQELLRAFLASGEADLRVQIDRLSKLQAAMDRMQSGAAMGLAILGPYVEVDAKSDTMKSKLSLRGGEALLNGRKNPAIEELLRNSLR